MWVADSNENKIYAYRLSNAAVLSSLSLSGATLSPPLTVAPLDIREPFSDQTSKRR